MRKNEKILAFGIAGLVVALLGVGLIALLNANGTSYAAGHTHTQTAKVGQPERVGGGCEDTEGDLKVATWFVRKPGDIMASVASERVDQPVRWWERTFTFDTMGQTEVVLRCYYEDHANVDHTWLIYVEP